MSVVFSDSSGREWQLYQVHRASHAPGAVSPGRERGWLAFTCETERRRLAAFPDDWETLGPAEWDRLRQQADIVPMSAQAPTFERPRGPRVVAHVEGTPEGVRT